MKNLLKVYLKSNSWIALLFLSLSSFGQNQRFDGLIDDFIKDPEHIMVAAHRAMHPKHPENSLAAVRENIDLGVDILEIDIRESKDGKLVLMHDETIDRTTNGKGKVSDLDFSTLKDVNLIHNEEITVEHIPTFEALLEIAKGKIMIDVDFKEDDPTAIKKAYTLIKKHHMEEQILFYIYDNYQLIPLLRDLNPKIKIMPRAYSRKDIRKILKIGGIKVIHIDESFYKNRIMQKIRSSGARIWSNALGKYDQMERRKKDSGFSQLREKKYINVIQTDLPEELLHFLRENQTHP